MEAPFYIGQEVVAIRDHSMGFFKKGQEFTVLGIKKSCCEWDVNIGHTYNFNIYSGYAICGICNKKELSDKYMHYSSICFAPKQHISSFKFEDAINLVSNKETIEI